MEKVQEIGQNYREYYESPIHSMISEPKPALPQVDARIMLEEPALDDAEWDFIDTEDYIEDEEEIIEGGDEEGGDEEGEAPWALVGDTNGPVNVNRETSSTNFQIVAGKTVDWMGYGQSLKGKDSAQEVAPEKS
jgi:hypothetical protein